VVTPTSRSPAPDSPATRASRSLICDVWAPCGKPITVVGPTSVPRRRLTTNSRSAGRQQIVAVCHSIATSIAASTSARVNSGRRIEWSMQPISVRSSRAARSIGPRLASRGFTRFTVLPALYTLGYDRWGVASARVDLNHARVSAPRLAIILEPSRMPARPAPHGGAGASIPLESYLEGSGVRDDCQRESAAADDRGDARETGRDGIAI